MSNQKCLVQIRSHLIGPAESKALEDGRQVGTLQ